MHSIDLSMHLKRDKAANYIKSSVTAPMYYSVGMALTIVCCSYQFVYECFTDICDSDNLYVSL